MRLKTKHLFLLVAVMVFGACSPKITSTKTPANKPVEKEKPVENKPSAKFTTATISVLVPFKLNQVNVKTADKAQVEKSAMAIDFYQGLMLGIDSAAKQGLNFNINVYDTRDDNAQLATVLKRDAIKKSNLVIGPVFPEGVKYITSFSISNNLPIVSPLAASKPSEFGNPQLISMVNSIDQHAINIGHYIAKNYQASSSIVVLINTKSSADEQYAAPLRSLFKQQYPKFTVQEFSSTYAFETKMIKGKKYAVVLCSPDTKFVQPSLLKLSRLKSVAGYDINLFGHPNWMKQTYNIEQLQRLNTIISTSYKVDYKSSNVINFIKHYRQKYSFEPTEYSFKGFDIGFYFGKLLTNYGEKYLDFITKENYKGLHNAFDFEYHPQYGYYNKDLFLLQYKNLALNIVD